MSYVTYYQSGVSGILDMLTGNSGGTVGPDASHNINLVATGALSVVGTPVTNTLTIAIVSPVPVADGGTGTSSLADHGVLVGSGTGAITALTPATNGQLIIGRTGFDPSIGSLTSFGGTINVTNLPGSISIDVSASSIGITQLDGNTGTAVPLLGVVDVIGGTNITTAAAVSSLSVNLDADISGMSSVDFATGGRIGTGLVAGNTALLRAYDTLGASYTTFATLTANNPATMDLSDDVTKAGNYIYRGGGTDVPVTDGGTGASTLLDHGVLVGSGTAAITDLAVGTDGQLLIGATGADPAFATLTSTGSTIAFTPGASALNLETGATVPVSFTTDAGSAVPVTGALSVLGGTNINTGGATSVVTVNLDSSITGMASIVMANGGNIATDVHNADTVLFQAYDVDGATYATFATMTAANDPSMNLADNVTKGGGYIYRGGGTDVPVSDGGTGASTLTDHGVLVGSGTSAITDLSVGTDGQVLLGATGADPAFATLTSTGGTIAFTPGANTLNLESTASGGMAWAEATGATQAMAVNTGYITNNGNQLVYTLPASASVGDLLAVVGNSTDGWQIAQNASQTIHYISLDTTTGVGGSLTSTNRYDCIELICITADTDFVVRSSVGNITVV